MSNQSGQTVGTMYRRARSKAKPSSEHRPLRTKNQPHPNVKYLCVVHAKGTCGDGQFHYDGMTPCEAYTEAGRIRQVNISR